MTLEPKTVPTGALRRWAVAGLLDLIKRPASIIPATGLSVLAYAVAQTPVASVPQALTVKLAVLLIGFLAYSASFLAAIARLPSTGRLHLASALLAHLQANAVMLITFTIWLCVMTPLTWTSLGHDESAFILWVPVCVASAMSRGAYLPMIDALSIRWQLTRSVATELSKQAVVKNPHIRSWATPLHAILVVFAITVANVAADISPMLAVAANLTFASLIAQAYEEIFHGDNGQKKRSAFSAPLPAKSVA